MLKRVNSNPLVTIVTGDVEDVSVATSTSVSSSGVQKTRSQVSLNTLVPTSEPVDQGKRGRRKKNSCNWCVVQQVCIAVSVFSFICWATYLFLTKDE